jgi:heme/copper-type cytochrome/quinol oxidase subunit 3
MTTEDHNKTLVILHSAIASILTGLLLAAPWFIPQAVRHREQIPLAVGFSVVLLVAGLLWSTAVAMQRRKPAGRTLALISAVVVLILAYPIGVYSWWFMHSEGAKRMYGKVKE